MKKKFFALLCLLVGMFCLFAGCTMPETPSGSTDGGGTEQPADPQKPTSPTEPAQPQQPAQPQKPAEPAEPEGFSVKYRAGYTPERFAKDVENQVTELGEGVHLVKNTVVKKDGKTSVVWAVEVDLTKAGIVAGTKDNKTEDFNFVKDVPYQMAQAWEQATGGHVYTSLNADFFGAYCVNAFVKDGIIIKDGHNDNHNYDYKQDASDVPASAPMLFGVKGDKAQIAPILSAEGDPETPAVKEKFVKGKLTYRLGEYDVLENAALAKDHITFLREGDSARHRTGYAVKVDTTKGIGALEVLEVAKAGGEKLSAGEGYGYLLATESTGACSQYLSKLKPGDKLSLSVHSPDGAWDGYETILGCRQALVTGGKIASTVTKENSNGAQGSDIPRSAVGLKDDHTVVIFAVESLHYYGNNVQKDDPHGMNLPELAEFAYYYGCSEAANFDGGGSTQLIARGENDETARVVVRSADTGTDGLTSTRPVMNAILVVKK